MRERESVTDLDGGDDTIGFFIDLFEFSTMAGMAWHACSNLGITTRAKNSTMDYKVYVQVIK